jgi:hypothetical protein
MLREAHRRSGEREKIDEVTDLVVETFRRRMSVLGTDETPLP